jgi:nucleoside 2-deoxyribosyltransferase
MASRPTVYLAGPEVFLGNVQAVGRSKKLLCERYGFEGLFPFENEVGSVPEDRADHLIYQANVAMMRRADLGIFNLTPFLGPSADVGTVFELGLMTALGKPCLGYTSLEDDLAERLRRLGIHGFRVENFGNADNLMIDAALATAGNPLIRVKGGEGRLDDLRGFEACLATAANRLGLRTATELR